MIWLIILLVALIAGFGLYFVSVYNRFQQLKNAGEAQLQQIRVAMKKRFDMLTKLVDSVKSYAGFEKDTMEKVTQMRSAVGSASVSQLNNADSLAKSLMGRLAVTVENYPDLKTSQTVKELMDSVKNVEDEIARQRYTYNNISQEFNTMLSTIPSNFVGMLSSMKKMDYLNEKSENPDLAWKV